MDISDRDEHHEGDALFRPQAHALQTEIQAFTPQLQVLHQKFNDGEFTDWPTVLLTSILQTTAVSLFKLLPPPQASNEAVDKRSIASLIRNIVDTHDAIDMLSAAETAEEFTIHRDILGYYLSQRIHEVWTKISAEDAGTLYADFGSKYWKRISGADLDKRQLNRIKGLQEVVWVN